MDFHPGRPEEPWRTDKVSFLPAQHPWSGAHPQRFVRVAFLRTHTPCRLYPGLSSSNRPGSNRKTPLVGGPKESPGVPPPGHSPRRMAVRPFRNGRKAGLVENPPRAPDRRKSRPSAGILKRAVNVVTAVPSSRKWRSPPQWEQPSEKMLTQVRASGHKEARG